MFKSVEEFRRFNSKLALRCIFAIYTVLTFAYIIELVKGNRTVNYVLAFLGVLWIPYLVTKLTSVFPRYSNYTSISASLGYLAFYGFCMVTTVSEQTWIYVFPFAALVPLLFNSLRQVILVYSSFFGINVIDAIGSNAFEDLVAVEQRFACILLVLVFLTMLSVLLKRYENIVQTIYKEASIDQLTGLKSNDYVADRVIPMIDRNKNITYTMVLVNIDKFYKFNDEYSHTFGDKILIKVGQVITEVVEPIKANTTCCRIYGDKFLLVFNNRSYDEVAEYYKTIKLKLNALIFRKDGVELFLSTTISVTDTRLCGHTYEEMYKRIRFLQDVCRSNEKNSLIEDSIELQ